MAQRILALELAGDEVRAALAERSWSSFALLGAFSEQRADDEPDLSPALIRLVGRTGPPDIVISALGGELVAGRLLELPFHDRRRLDQAVPFALEEHLPFSIEDGVVAYTTVGREGPNALVMAALARKGDLRNHLELLAKAGLDPKTVTLSVLALPALLAKTRNGKASCHLVLDMDRVRTSMVLTDSNGSPRVVRTVTAPFPGRNGTPAPRASAAPMLSAVRQILLAHTADPERPDLIVTGPVAAIPEVRDELSRELAVTVRGAEELDWTGVFDGLTPETLRFAGCVAMLLGELPAAPAELLNFREGEFTFRGHTSDLTPLYSSGRIAIALGAVLLLHLTLSLVGGLHRLHLLDRQIRVAAAAALGPNPPSNVKAALSGKIAEMNRLLGMTGRSPNGDTPLDLLRAISRAIPARIPVDLSEMLIDPAGVKLAGKTDSFASIDAIKRSLAKNGGFSDIQVTDAKVAADPGKVEFRLSAALGGAPAGAD